MMIVVNDSTVTLREALGWTAMFDLPSLLDTVIEQVAVAQLAEEVGHEVVPDEVKELFAELRYMNHLETSDALKQWLDDNLLDLSIVQSGCQTTIMRRKLRAGISADDIYGFYVENKPAYERAEVYTLTVDAKETAEELRSQIVDEDESFCLLAMQYSLDDSTAKMGGYMGEVSRSSVSGAAENAIFGASAGDILGPIEAKSGWQLFLVHSSRTQELSEVELDITETIFEEMIGGAIQRARVEYQFTDWKK